MRHRAKPFTVEIKKSRKASSEPQSLFGAFDMRPEGFEEPSPPTPVRPAERHPAETEALALADQVFGGAASPAAEMPATRILPDLTARPVGMPQEEDQPRRRGRMKMSPKPKIPPPKPVPISPMPALARPAAKKAVALPTVQVRVRTPRDGGERLPRGERWKRRLPRFAR